MENVSKDDEVLSNNSKTSILYNKYKDNMFRIAYSILHNEEQSNDAVHDAFIKLMPYIDKIDDSSLESDSTQKLLLLSIKNTAIDTYRRNKKEAQLFVKNQALIDIHGSKSSSIKTFEDKDLIKQILSSLPPKYREIIKYHSYYNLTYSEIASILNISKDVAAKRFERAKKLVSKMMGDESYE